jgi:hypothetical protein
MDTSGVPMTGSRTVFVLTGCSIAPTTQRFGERAEADTTHRAEDAEGRRER